MPRRRRRRVAPLLFLAALALAGWYGWSEYQRMVREHPERFPWTPLALDQPVGRFTRAKLVALGDDPAQCRALLGAVGDEDRAAPPRRSSEPACGFDDAMLLVPDGKAMARFAPTLVTACPVAAALRLWERDTVQPAALRHFGARVAGIENFGSYECRRIGHRDSGRWSEHATGDAIDVSGFRLSNGRRISVRQDWTGSSPASLFLRDARDGACRLFGTVLSPDYNAAHVDHLHLDMESRGGIGVGYCR